MNRVWRWFLNLKRRVTTISPSGFEGSFLCLFVWCFIISNRRGNINNASSVRRHESEFAHESVWSIWIDEKFGKALLICMLVCVFTCLMFLSFKPMWYYHLFASANSVFALAYVKHHDGIGGKRARKKLWNFNSIHAQSQHNAPMISQSRRD